MLTYESMKQTIEARHPAINRSSSLDTKNTMSRILRTENDWQLTLSRMILGTIMFPHGAQKGLGWFGGSGLSGTMKEFKEGMGIPKPLAAMATAAELFGSIALITGFMSRVAAFGIVTNMAVATLKVHRPQGFFMNWYGNKKGEGYEYHLLAMALGFSVLLKGGGALSLDRWLDRSFSRREPSFS